MKLSNARYADPTNTYVDVDIDHPVHGAITFTAGPGDASAEAILARIHAGEAGTIAPYVKSKAARKAEIMLALADLDAKSIRPARASDTARLAALEAQAVPLRAELAGL